MKKVVIAGGTGFIGTKLSHFFASKGYQVILITRNKNNLPDQLVNIKNLIPISWEDDTSSVIKVIEGSQAIIVLAGENISNSRWSNSFKQKIISSRMNAIEKIMSWSKKLQEKPHILIASALSFYGSHKSDHKPYNENDKSTNTQNFLCNLANNIEQNKFTKNTDIPITYMRFALVLDFNGGVLKKIALPIKFYLGAIMGDGKNAWSWISLDDLVSAIYFCINKKITGPVNFISTEKTSQNKFMSAIATELQRKIFFSIPKHMLYIIFGKEMSENIFLTGTYAKPNKLLENNFKFKHTSIKKFLKQNKR